VSQVRERCIDRGVGTELCPIDEVRQASLAHFTCLILILPSPLAGRSDLRPFARLIDDYRAGRPEGLVSIRNGSCKWFHAGVVQVVGQQLAAQHLKEIRSDLTDLVCVWHSTDDSEPLDVFLPYSARFVMPTQRSSQSSDIDRLWIYVQTWGITKRDDVPLLWNCIESCRAIFQNGNKYPVSHRPIPGFDKSMLDIILDVSESDFPPLISERIKQNNKFRKAYTENGARVYMSEMSLER
jgi:hypothetical protein